MKRTHRLFLLLLLFLLPILACGPLGGNAGNNEPTAVAEAPTNTPEPQPTATTAPTNTPEPTATAAPTNTPEPTATPEATATAEPVVPVIPEGFQLLESAEGGITAFYPADWFSADFLGLITLASDPALLESVDSVNEGAVAIIVSDSVDADLGLPVNVEDGALAVVTSIANDPSILDLGTDYEVAKPPVQAESAAGQDAATTVIYATSETGTRVAYVVKFVITETRVAVFIGATPVETLEQYEETLDTIGNSIVLGEPTAATGGDGDTPPPPVAGDAQLVVLGDIIEGQLTEEVAQADFVYTAAAGETLSFAIVPETDDQDLVLALYAADNTNEALVEVDDGFSGEAEAITYTFDAAGDYIIRVAEFGFPDAGSFFLFIGDEAISQGLLASLGATELTIGEVTGDLPEGESEQNFIYAATGGESLTLVLTPGNTDMDVVIEIYSVDDLTSPVARIDEGFSGEAETLTYTFSSAGTYVVTISEYFGTAGPYTLVVTE